MQQKNAINISMLGLTQKEKLLRAVADGHLDLIKSLLKENTDINSKGQKLLTPLLVASYSMRPSLIDFLSKRGANVYDKTKECNTSINFMCSKSVF